MRPERVAIAILAVVLSALAAAPAVGSNWTHRQLTEVGQAPLFGISCPTSSLCVAVGGGNTIASSANPAGGAGDWSVINPGGVTPPNQSAIRGVSCPSPQLCVAVSFRGQVLTSTNPTGGLGAWNVAELNPSGPKTHLYGVSCPSTTFCVASAGGAKILTSTNPTGGPGAWTTTQLEGPLELRGVSCTSPAFCVVVGDNGGEIRPGLVAEGVVLTSTNPLGGAWQTIQTPGSPGNLYGVSCPSPALCVTGNMLGDLLISTEPTGPASAWPLIDGGGSVQITGVDCPTVTRCVVVDNNADVLTSTEPTGGPGKWTFANLIPYTEIDGTFLSNAFWGASCPTVSFCAISAGDGQVFTSDEPFAVPPESNKDGEKKSQGKGRRKGPKRPRVTLALRPFPAIELDRGKVTVRFRFYALHRVPVRGFVCKIDTRVLKRCQSPKSYRVGVGRHRFQVHAVGWSGLKGPAERASFEVCRPLAPTTPKPPPCWKGPFPPGAPPPG